MVERMNGHVKDEGAGVGTGTTTSNAYNNAAVTDDNICRDFLRNVCRRGKRCKFRHPEDSDAVSLSNHQSKSVLTFCHDHQNGNCSRSICRFIHCTCEEEDYYIRIGYIPPHILDQAIRKGQIIDPTLNGDVPICKDYLMGECSRRRGGKCKFRHLTQLEYDEEIYGKSRRDSDSRHCDKYKTASNPTSPPDAKRQRYDTIPQPNQDFNRPMEEVMRNDMLVGRDIGLREYRDRECDRNMDEILILRKQLDNLKNEIASLKKENSDLRATNDFLLDKVTSLGLSKAGTSVTTVTVPTVSMATTIPVATSVQPLTAAQVSHPLSISSDGSVVTLPPSLAPPRAQPPPQSMATSAVAPSQSAVVGSVGGVVTLSQAPTLTAVTLSTVNLNPTITPITSMAPSIAAQQPRTAQSLAQAISLSGATGHLVTYPIMTQPGLRPQIQ